MTSHHRFATRWELFENEGRTHYSSRPENKGAVAGKIPVDDVNEMAIPSYFHWNPAVRWIITKRLNTIVEVAGFNSSDSVLDFGTGTGILLPTLSRMVKSVVATDLRPELAQS